MKVFIGCRMTGEDPETLKNMVSAIVSSLKQAGHEPYTSLFRQEYFEENNVSRKDRLLDAFKEIDKTDIFLSLYKSEETSMGMLMEYGYVISKKKPIYLAIQKDIEAPFIRSLAEKVIEYETLDELYEELKTLN